VRDAQNYVEMVRRNFSDERQQMLATRALMLDEVKSQMEKAKVMGGFQINRAELDLMSQQVGMQGEKALASLQMEAAKLRQNQLMLEMKMRSAQTPARVNLRHFQMTDPQKATNDATKKAQALDPLYGKAMRTLDSLIQLREKEGAVVAPKAAADRFSKVQQDYNRYRSRLVDIIRDMYNYGARFEDTEERLLNAYVPEDPGRVGPVLHNLEQFRTEFEQEFRDQMFDYGFE